MTYTCEDLLKHVGVLIDSCEIELRMYETHPISPMFKTMSTYLETMQENARNELEHYKQMKESILNENTITK